MQGRPTWRSCCTALAVLCLFAVALAARADVAFLMEEPYGGFGSVNPTGHGALYFNHICAASPTRLRPCRAGEQGVVVSRYHKVGGYDWLAVPAVPYFYAVERLEDAPLLADAAMRDRLRNAYRREHLTDIVPDDVTEDGMPATPKGDWYQLVGSSYDRRIYGFQIETTREEDERFMARYNDHRNVSHFNLFFHNCADFSRIALNSFFPHAVRRNYFADFGLTTPKQVAKSLQHYAKKNPQRSFTVFVVPQVMGTIPRSHTINGVAESLVKSKKYVVPLAFLTPHATVAIGVSYLAKGRFSAPASAEQVKLPGEDASVIVARQQERTSPNAVVAAEESGVMQHLAQSQPQGMD